MKYLGLFLFLHFLLTSCSPSVNEERIPSRDFIATYEKVITLSRDRPDSALLVAKEGLQLAQHYSDTARAYMHIAVGIGYKEAGMGDSALVHYKKAETIAAPFRDPEILSSVYNNRALILKQVGDFPGAQRQFRKSLNLRQKMMDSTGMARCLQNMANVQKRLNSPDSAIHYAYAALEIQRASGNLSELGGAWTSLGSIYLFLEDKPSSLKAYRNAQRLFKEQNELKQLGIVYFNLGNYWINEAHTNGYLDSAETNFRRAQTTFQEAGSTVYDGYVFDAFGSIFLLKEQYEKASRMFRRSKKVYTAQNDTEGIILAQIHLFESLSALQIGDSAITSIRQAKKLSIETKNTKYLNDIHLLMAALFENENRADSTAFHLKKSHHLEDSLKSSEVLERIEQSEQKNKITLLEKENLKAKTKDEKRIRQLYVLTSIIISLLIISILIAILFRQRLKTKNQLASKNEELHQRKLEELIKEQELEKITKLMEGQEKERKRISGELHDGLGSLLATVKHHFEVVEDKMDTNKESYVKAYGLLDQASEEVRRISHNMASNVLSKFGLVAALQDLCEMLNSSKKQKIELKVTGLEGRLENSTEIHLFRICQELVSNALKHAKASVISLQITMRSEVLSLIIEDNGVGFKPEEAQQSPGMGLENLKARVVHLGGTMDIDSVIGRGTAFVIEVPV